MKGINKLTIQLTLLAAGYCTHPEWITLRGGSFRSVPFPAGFACIQHPRLGVILFDTGYSSRFFAATERFPFSMYRKLTPVIYEDSQSAVNQLNALGIASEEVKLIVLSHFHADHLGGLRDFPNAQFIYLQAAYNAVKDRRGLSALRAGYLSELLPDDFIARSLPIDEAQQFSVPKNFPFRRVMDILGDGSLIAVDLPGHAAGQIGLMVATDQQSYLLCADTVWSSRAYREHRLPNLLAGLIMSSRTQYQDSFERLCSLHEQYPQLQIVPSHCPTFYPLAPQKGVL
ncbi:MBL fold metallo-hydrolase [Paenibacillus psychroresistens]|uniref:MBL fold metallo-hydrolase n=1 Tax=Paenibacillus psychroresistens TaxID=1778678 RepID=A0A6B8RXB1_9BACL|nr:MBL fold metallo-hydrolase [Paenibacillus psychroresistens]QGQ99648.1 MBL fold metallo-hydrolase [Paenibacillus psychroresistens]